MKINGCWRTQARRKILQSRQEDIRDFSVGLNVSRPSPRPRPALYRLGVWLYGGGFFLLGVVAV